MSIFTGQAGMKLNVDKAFCLSLREAENRRAYLKSEFEKINQDVEFILNDRSHNPQKAISKSHQDLCGMASENNWETVLIFEDDVRFYDFNPIQIAQINFFFGPEQNLGHVLSWRDSWGNVEDRERRHYQNSMRRNSFLYST